MTSKLVERYAIIRIAYSYDQDRSYNGDEPEQIAVGLALNPITSTFVHLYGTNWLKPQQVLEEVLPYITEAEA